MDLKQIFTDGLKGINFYLRHNDNFKNIQITLLKIDLKNYELCLEFAIHNLQLRSNLIVYNIKKIVPHIKIGAILIVVSMSVFMQKQTYIIYLFVRFFIGIFHGLLAFSILVNTRHYYYYFKSLFKIIRYEKQIKRIKQTIQNLR